MFIVPDYYEAEGVEGQAEEAVLYKVKMERRLVHAYDKAHYLGLEVLEIRGEELWNDGRCLGRLHAVPDFVGKLLKHDYVRTSRGWWVLQRG